MKRSTYYNTYINPYATYLVHVPVLGNITLNLSQENSKWSLINWILASYTATINQRATGLLLKPNWSLNCNTCMVIICMHKASSTYIYMLLTDIGNREQPDAPNFKNLLSLHKKIFFSMHTNCVLRGIVYNASLVLNSYKVPYATVS